MRISSIRAFPIRLPRDVAASKGTAGSPTSLQGEGVYRWSTAYPVLYSTCFETALVRVRLSDGTEGWGESQAPLAPEIAAGIVNLLLRPALEGEPFDGSRNTIEELWRRMYSTMRVRGQTGGFMLDAIAGVDLALWDAAGKLAGKPVSQLFALDAKTSVPAYLSGTAGDSPQARADYAKGHGLPLVKLYFDRDWDDLLATAEAVRGTMRFAVDALWHLPPGSAMAMGKQLDAAGAQWLECPLYPEELADHVRLAKGLRTPIAIGESYRTRTELRPFVEGGACGVLQPDLGRSGLTESLAIAAEFGLPVIPHVSIAMGPQIAAAIHFAAAVPNCALCEYNPSVLQMANAFLAEPITLRDGGYVVPSAPGLGVVWSDRLVELIQDQDPTP